VKEGSSMQTYAGDIARHGEGRQLNADVCGRHRKAWWRKAGQCRRMRATC